MSIPRSARRVAVFLPTWVGDTVMSTPVLRALRELRPGARITVVARRGVDELLRGCPWVDEVVVDSRDRRAPWTVSRALRERQIEAAIVLPSSFRSAWIVRLSGTPIRIGYRKDARGWLLTEALPFPRERPINHVDLWALLGERAIDGPVGRAVELFVTAEEERAAAACLDGVGGPFVVLVPGGENPRKHWPIDRFAALATELAESRGLVPVVSGSPKERDLVRRVLEAVPSPLRDRAVDLAARGVTLGALKAIVRRASLMVSNDTGPRHLAAALGTAVVSLFGPTDPRWTDLRCPHERMIAANPELLETRIADSAPEECRMERISVETVLAAAGALLDAVGGDRAPAVSGPSRPPSGVT